MKLGREMGGGMKEMVEGFVVEGVPFIFESKELAIRAMFPVKLTILKYEEEEEVSLDDKL